jgi:DAACS family dicarboxylate/amino acid:cation (Na+ or H+) symporter
MKLHTRILLGLAAGGVVGFAARHSDGLARVVGWLEPAGTIFIRLITMVVVPLVIAGLFVGIASLGDIRRLGRIGGRTLAYFLVTTTLAATIGVAVALLTGAGRGATAPLSPTASVTAPVETAAEAKAVPTLWQTLVGMVPANPIAAAAQGDLLAIIFTVVLFAAATTTLDAERRRPLVAFFGALNDASLVVIRWLMWLAPVAVAILIAVTVLRSGAELLRSLASYAAIVVAALVVHVAVVLIPILRVAGGLRPSRFVAAVGDVLVLAFSTAASSVTLPVSLAAAQSRVGISTEVSTFVLTTGTTLNKNGAAVYKAVTAVFLAHLYGVDLGVGALLTIVVTTVVAASAGAGVPGSSLVTTLIVLNAIGLGANASAGIAIVAGIDRPLDMCRTAVNTFGNLVGAAVVARGEGERLRLS